MPNSLGSDLMRRIHDGSLTELPTEYLADTREKISTALEELIDVGARIRRLAVAGKPIGWVRGVHLFERKVLHHWVSDDLERSEYILRIGTTLSNDEIHDLSTLEMRNLGRLVRSMTESDLKLYPYIGAFVSTSSSEHLWFSRGAAATSFQDRTITMPDGARMEILRSSDQARLWTVLCQARVSTQQRLEAASNAVLTIRPWVGKGADQLSHRITSMARGLQTDSFEPWKDLISLKPTVAVDDGWAHSEDDSIDGMLRELRGMANFDRHEQVVAACEKQLRDSADLERRKAEERIARKMEIEEEDETPRFQIMTEEEVQAQRRKSREQVPTLHDVSDREEIQSSVADRLAKYK